MCLTIKYEIVHIHIEQSTPNVLYIIFCISFAESSTEDWEQDFDVDLTEEDLQAAQALASKLDMSSAEYSTITGEVTALSDFHLFVLIFTFKRNNA